MRDSENPSKQIQALNREAEGEEGPEPAAGHSGDLLYCMSAPRGVETELTVLVPSKA